MIKYLGKVLFWQTVLSLCMYFNVHAQTPVTLQDTINQHIFSNHEIECFEDATRSYSLSNILSPVVAAKFKPSKENTPVAQNNNSVYWYRINIKNNIHSKNNWILEFFDQTIDDIIIYSPTQSGSFTATHMGASQPFTKRSYQHKNFGLNISNNKQPVSTYYIRIQSHQPANVIVVLRSVNWFIHYAIDEYFFFGIFYGMILVFSLYNLVMFLAMRHVQYLYYIMYNLSIGLYEMCADGIAYQYIWPTASGWNQYAYGTALYSSSIFALLFTQSLLYVSSKAKTFNKLIWWVIALRTLFFLACLLINKSWFTYKIVEVVPLTVAYATGWRILYKGYWPARYFVVGYTFLIIGFVIKLLIALNVSWLPFGPVTHYSLSVCFIMEMLFISFAIGDKVRILKTKKEKVHRKMIQQFRINEHLKDNLNRNLEKQVNERTREVVEKSSVIEAQNQELKMVNALLQQKTEEISRMNVLLEEDNSTLQTNIEKVTHDRVMSAEVDFEEFSRIYPDRESCFKFLADLKWSNGYFCRKCGSTLYNHGHLPFSRRCSKCSYEESPIAYTILQNTRIPINKAFYMVFMIYSTKGKISSYKLSELLSVRQSTCWAYSTRIKKVMDDKKKEFKKADKLGWSKLMMEQITL